MRRQIIRFLPGSSPWPRHFDKRSVVGYIVAIVETRDFTRYRIPKELAGRRGPCRLEVVDLYENISPSRRPAATERCRSFSQSDINFDICYNAALRGPAGTRLFDRAFYMVRNLNKELR